MRSQRVNIWLSFFFSYRNWKTRELELNTLQSFAFVEIWANMFQIFNYLCQKELKTQS